MSSILVATEVYRYFWSLFWWNVKIRECL